MRITAPTILLFALVMTMACCCASEEENPTLVPSTELPTTIQRHVHGWLDSRMDESTWSVFSDANAGWRGKWSLEEISKWFETFIEPEEPEWWRFADLVWDIQKTDLYLQSAPTETEFFDLVTLSLRSFTYEE